MSYWTVVYVKDNEDDFRLVDMKIGHQPEGYIPVSFRHHGGVEPVREGDRIAGYVHPDDLCGSV